MFCFSFVAFSSAQNVCRKAYVVRKICSEGTEVNVNHICFSFSDICRDFRLILQNNIKPIHISIWIICI